MLTIHDSPTHSVKPAVSGTGEIVLEICPASPSALAEALLAFDSAPWLSLLDGTPERALELTTLSARSSIALARWAGATGGLRPVYDALGFPDGADPLRVLDWIVEAWDGGRAAVDASVCDWCLHVGAQAFLLGGPTGALRPYSDATVVVNSMTQIVYELELSDWPLLDHHSLAEGQRAGVRTLSDGAMGVRRLSAKRLGAPRTAEDLRTEALSVVERVFADYAAGRPCARKPLTEADLLMLSMSDVPEGRAAAIVLASHLPPPRASEL